jgi:hypothetical protein
MIKVSAASASRKEQSFSTPLKRTQKPEDYKIPRKNTASALQRRTSSSSRVWVVNVTQPQNAPLSEHTDFWETASTYDEERRFG